MVLSRAVEIRRSDWELETLAGGRFRFRLVGFPSDLQDGRLLIYVNEMAGNEIFLFERPDYFEFRCGALINAQSSSGLEASYYFIAGRCHWSVLRLQMRKLVTLPNLSGLSSESLHKQRVDACRTYRAFGFWKLL